MTRLHALDAARLLALLGIMVNHVFLLTDAPFAITLQDYHAVLFLLLSGIVFGYTDGAAPKRRVKNVVRAIAFILIGIALGSGNPAINIILVNYGIMTLLALVIRPKYPLAVGIGWLFVAPIASFVTRALTQDSWHLANIGVQDITQPWALIVEPVIYSHYPVLQWFGVFLVGVGMGARKKGKRPLIRNSKFMIGGGITAFLAVKLVSLLDGADLWGMGNGNVPTDPLLHLEDSGAYSGTTGDLLGATGVSMVVVGVMMMLGNRVKGWSWLGAATLTAYTVHVLIYLLTPLALITQHQYLFFAANIAVIALILGVWRATTSRREQDSPGPLEWVIEYVARTEQAKRQVS